MTLLINEEFTAPNGLNNWTTIFKDTPGATLTLPGSYLGIEDGGNGGVVLLHNTVLTHLPGTKYFVEVSVASLDPVYTPLSRYLWIGLVYLSQDETEILVPDASILYDLSTYTSFPQPTSEVGLSPIQGQTHARKAGTSNFHENFDVTFPLTFVNSSGFIEETNDPFNINFGVEGTPEIPSTFLDTITKFKLGIQFGITDLTYNPEAPQGAAAIEYIRLYDNRTDTSPGIVDDLSGFSEYGVITRDALNQLQLFPGKTYPQASLAGLYTADSLGRVYIDIYDTLSSGHVQPTSTLGSVNNLPLIGTTGTQNIYQGTPFRTYYFNEVKI